MAKTMSEPKYEDWFREENHDLAKTAAALRNFLALLDTAGIVEFDVDRDGWSVEVRFETTVAQARAMGYDDAAIAELIARDE